MRPSFIRRLAAVCLAAGVLRSAFADQPIPRTAADLFQLETVWRIHLKFSADQWKAMQPNEPEGFGPGPGGPGRPGRPGGPGGRGGGFGPGMFLAPAWMQQGDANRDGQLTAAEFEGLGNRWFDAWDKERQGSLTENALRDGLSASLGGPGGPGGLGGPGGPGGPGGGESFLQGRNGSRNGLSAARGIEFPFVRADLEFEGQSFPEVAVRYKGNGTFMQSRGGLKRSFKIDLNKHQKGQKLGGVTTLNLHNNITDASWMNEPLAHRLYREAGVPAPRSSYARVHVSVPGLHTNAYLGLYSLVENPDERFAEERYGTKKGLILKPVTQRLFEHLGDDWSRYQQ
ncbi:MAG: CotH kinase family protein, partial [Verrucomicrobiota bacterium]